jgi:hypothetical protein
MSTEDKRVNINSLLIPVRAQVRLPVPALGRGFYGPVGGPLGEDPAPDGADAALIRHLVGSFPARDRLPGFGWLACGKAGG